MKEMDLLRALTEIDDTLLLEPEKKSRRYPFGGGRKLLIAATAAVLLISTAFAVTLGLYTQSGQETVRLEGVSIAGKPESVTYHTLDITFDLAPVRTVAEDFLREKLKEAWVSYAYDKEAFTEIPLTNADGSLFCFTSCEEAAELLGISLCLSPELDAAVEHIYVTMTVTDPTFLAEAYEAGERPLPDGLILQAPLTRSAEPTAALYARRVWEAGLTVSVPLTENYNGDTLRLYSSEAQGAYREQGMTSSGGTTVLLLENLPCEGYPTTGSALWCWDGIGYHVRLQTDAQTLPLPILTPLIRNLSAMNTLS